MVRINPLNSAKFLNISRKMEYLKTTGRKVQEIDVFYHLLQRIFFKTWAGSGKLLLSQNDLIYNVDGVSSCNTYNTEFWCYSLSGGTLKEK